MYQVVMDWVGLLPLVFSSIVVPHRRVEFVTTMALL